MNLQIPDTALVVLVGISGAGKSTFAREHFQPNEVLSSDTFRGLVSNDTEDLSATADAFEALHFVVATRLRRGLLTVVDATNVQVDARQPLVKLARDHDVFPVAVVLDTSLSEALERNRTRTDRAIEPDAIRRQHDQLRRTIRRLQKEGFRFVHVIGPAEDPATVTLTRQPAWNNRPDEHGPFDIIGDVHGCFDELRALLEQLGYAVTEDPDAPRPHSYEVSPPAGRRAIFLGDLVDRGPDSPRVLGLAISMVAAGTALCVPGNHDVKLARALRGRKVQITHGLAESLEQLDGEPKSFRDEVAGFLEDLVSHYVLDDGNLVVAHAGMKEAYQGRTSGRVRDFALFGETTGETDEFGLPIRYPWAEEYRGTPTVVYGHTAVAEAAWVNRTICIDTGCVFGGQLTALRYPERELVSVPAARTYYDPIRPLAPPAPPERARDLLDINDVANKRIIPTSLAGNVTVRAEQSAAAIEVMTRYAIDPRWLIFLPPTISPPDVSALPELLEHPTEVFRHFRNARVSSVICEEKHMGSRAIAIVCRDPDVAAANFAPSDAAGRIYTRTGRPFFEDPDFERDLLDRLRSAINAAGLWDELDTDWLALDGEIMPWSYKARRLIDGLYRPVGDAASHSLAHASDLLRAASERGVDTGELQQRMSQRTVLIANYRAALEPYDWTVGSPSDLRFAPFQLLAAAGQVLARRNHRWHMEAADRLAASDGVIVPTASKTVDLNDADSWQAATDWWTQLTSSGGEGMVVKPIDDDLYDRRRFPQAAVKVRGSEYLRIIYGPEYTLPENLDRLRQRSVARKRSLATREHALGIEALDRFTAGEPLYRTHECAFAVLALESDPVDPRL